ncbi:MAG: DUF4229 domain-containing protein [Nocardioides sp.]|nr:DUF4229 domain-containing protein [Nocardioides sp.]
MKEFAVYTALRLVLLVASFGLIAGLWSLATDGEPHLFWSLILAFIVSGVASYYLLNRQREAFAQRVEARAAKASEAFERHKAKEDTEDPA